MATFVDRVTIHAQAGKGGNGCVSVRREKFKPLGGPDGANGGNGGSIILRASQNVTTLLAFHHSPHCKGENGQPGAGDMRPGKKGKDVYLDVPVGTSVTSMSGEFIADLVYPGQEHVLARGGRGGLGNAALATVNRKAPGFALLGDEGESVDAVLELKSVADVALVGFPSAGKSSLISTISAAKPKIADYPFTTLIPHLGVVQAGDTRYTVADVPGLIPGASQGKGLGLEFLRHIERCSVIAHVVDCATLEPGRDPLTDIQVIEDELRAYAQQLQSPDDGRPPLMDRPRVIVLNKIDVPEARELAEFVAEEWEGSQPVFLVSTASHEGLRELTFALGALVSKVRAQYVPHTPARIVVRPQAKNDPGFTVSSVKRGEEEFFVIRGEKPELWVRQTDFDNDEAVGYLADRLAKLGTEKALLDAGAHAGDMVVIGPPDSGYIFDWEPTMATGAELLGPRGTDLRLDVNERPTRSERKASYYERMDAKAQARQELWTEREEGHWVDPSSQQTGE